MLQTLSDPLPCPRCDRKGFVRCSDDVFQCIYCDYLKKLPDERSHAPNSFLLWFFLAWGIVIVVALLTNGN